MTGNQRGTDRSATGRWAASLLSICWMLSAGGAQAATYIVDRLDDPNPPEMDCMDAVDDDCSLRGAIEKADGDATPDVITFNENGVITLDATLGQLTIDTAVTITGNGDNCGGTGTCIEAAATEPVSPFTGLFRVMSITGGTVNLSELTIRHGFGTPGGGIEVQENATVTLLEVDVEDNVAGRGGGIFNAGVLTMTDSDLTSNRALIGGGLFNNGTAEIISEDELDSEIDDNGALFGGGIANFGQVTVSGLPPGVAVSPGVTLRGVEVAENRALIGGGIWNDAGTVLLLADLFAAATGEEATVTIEVGDANLLVTDLSVVAANTALLGGGIANTRFPETFFLSQPTGTEPALAEPPIIGSAVATVDGSHVIFNGALLAGGVLNDEFITPLLLDLITQLGVVQPGSGEPATAGPDPGMVDDLLTALGSGGPEMALETWQQDNYGPALQALGQASTILDMPDASAASDAGIAALAADLGVSGLGSAVLTMNETRVEENGALIGGGVVNTGTATVQGAPENAGVTEEVFSSISANNFFLAREGVIPGPDQQEQIGMNGFGFLCGGLLNTGEMTVTATEVVENAALVGGGACNWNLIPEGGVIIIIITGTDGEEPPPGSAQLTLDDSLVAGNQAFAFGGIWNDANTAFTTLVIALSEIISGNAQPGVAEQQAATFGDAILKLQNQTLVIENGAPFVGGMGNTRFPQFLLEELSILLPPGGIADTAITDSAVVLHGASFAGGVLNDGLLTANLLLTLLDQIFDLGFDPFNVDLGLLDQTATRLGVQNSAIVENSAAFAGGLASFAATALLEETTVGDNGPSGAPAPFTAAGGILNSLSWMSLDRSTVDGNGASVAVETGGGILNDGLGEAVLDFVFDSFFELATSSPAVEEGDGFEVETILDLTATTVSDNHAEFEGGGLFNFGDPAVATITNSTFSGNESGEDGGAIDNEDLGTVNLNNVTITDNTAGAGGSAGNGGGIYEESFNFTINVKNSIIGGNQDLAAADGNEPDCSNPGGTINSLDFNVIGDETGCEGIFTQAGDQTGDSTTPLDPGLGPLADNGGPTQTHALCSSAGVPDASCTGTSPALDAVGGGSCTTNEGAALDADQRAFARPQNVLCDVGAYEVGCGDGIVDDGEQCDTGDLGGGGFPFGLGESDCCTDQCQLESPATVCRPAVDVCDAPETCADQVDGLCPADEVQPAGTECRAPADVCDPAEVCDGSSTSCPADVPFLDTDGDGACDGVEVPGDENDPTVASFRPGGGPDPKVKVELLGGCAQIENFQFLMEEDLPVQDPNYFYPCGFVSFELPCASADVKATFFGLSDLESGAFVYRKFNPNTFQYIDMPVPVQLMGNMATFSLTDGGPGDTDGVANGRITDPNGPGIGSAPAPALSLFGLLLGLVSLMGVAAWALRRRMLRS